MIPSFDVMRPRSLEEALDLLAERPEALPIAGGTNLLVDARSGKLRPQAVIDLGPLDELVGVDVAGGEMVIGACTTIAHLLENPWIQRHAAVLHGACRTFANTLIRNRATVGGNLVNNAPCADTAPALLVLDAEVELACVQGRRRLPLEEFLVEPFQTRRQSNELLTCIRFRIPAETAIGRFQKMGLRKISCMAKVDVAMLLDFESDGRCRTPRIASGAASPVARRAREAEAALTGRVLTEEVVRRAADATQTAAMPRAGSEYKQQVVAGLVRRLLTDIAREAGERHA